MIEYQPTYLGYNLWQGGVPPEGNNFAAMGFDVLVLCADEHQPPAGKFPGPRKMYLTSAGYVVADAKTKVLHCPMHDDGLPMRPGESARAQAVAEQVAQALREGRRVLVTCQMGRNRSGFVSTLALHKITGQPCRDIIKHIRHKRPGSLSNTYFVRELLRLC